MSAVHDQAKRLLEEKAVSAVLALHDGPEGPVPYLFTDARDVQYLADGPKYPLAKIAWRILRAMPENTHLTLVCRTCDARAVKEQIKMGQYRGRRIDCLINPCGAEQARACSCACPDLQQAEQQHPASALSPELDKLLTDPDRATLWHTYMQRCIKCYGCRNVCPVCVCPQCRLEDDAFAPVTVLPPPPLPWHLCRATHVAEHCVNCGACQDACPADIPLLALHKAIAGHLYEANAYLSGTESLSPLRTAAEGTGATGAAIPEWKNSAYTCPNK